MNKFDLYTVKETAEQIRRSIDFVYDEIDAGHLAHHRMAGRIFVSGEDLSQYVQRLRKPAYGERVRKKSERPAK